MQYQKIIYIEHDRIRTYQKSEFKESTSAELKTLASGAIIPLSLLDIQTLKFSEKINDEELKLQVEIRMYEEGNLSSSEEYTIAFISHTINAEDNILVEVFALSNTKADEYFAEALTKVDAIDIITPAFMVYAPFYDTLPKGNDLFIYLGEEESYGAIYQDGHYIAHRFLETITSIAVEAGFDIASLKNLLYSKGLVEENYSSQELSKFTIIQERIAKNVELLVRTVNHKRGIFGFARIDHIYLDFEGKQIEGLAEIFSAYGIADVEVVPLVQADVPAEQLHENFCASYFGQTQFPINLSPYERKESWYARESGKFITLVGAALLVVFFAYLAMEWMVLSEKIRAEELMSKIKTTHKETAGLSDALKKSASVLREKQIRSNELEEELALFRSAGDTVVLIEDIHTKRQKFLEDISAELGLYQLGATLMEQNSSKQMSLHVVADYSRRDDIAKFMSGMYKRGYQDARSKEIKLNDGSSTYGSLVEVIR